MESVGKYLKEKREKANLSIEEVSLQTRLKPYLLNQIEEDDFKAIGDTGFIKIMVVTYCRAVQGSEELVLKKLTQLFDQPTEPPIKINTAKNVKPVLVPTNLIYFFLLGCLVLLLSLGMYNLYKKGSFSLNDIKKQLASIEKTVRPVPQVVEVQPDTLWAQHRRLFHESNNITEEEPMTANTARVDTVPKVAKTENNIRTFNTSRHYLQDKTDYVGQLIFNNKPSPLNPDL